MLPCRYIFDSLERCRITCVSKAFLRHSQIIHTVKLSNNYYTCARRLENDLSFYIKLYYKIW